MHITSLSISAELPSKLSEERWQTSHQLSEEMGKGIVDNQPAGGIMRPTLNPSNEWRQTVEADKACGRGLTSCVCV